MKGAANDLDQYLDGDDGTAEANHAGTARRLLDATLRHPGPLAAGLLFVLISTAAALMEPWLFGYTIDEAIVPRNSAMLITLSSIFLLLVVAGAVATIAQTYLFELLGQAVTQDLRTAVFSHLQRLPLSLHDKNPAGRLLTRVTNDVAALTDVFTSGFVTAIGNVLLVAGILVWLVAMDLRLGLITISVFPFMLAVTAYFSRQLRDAYRKARVRLSILNAFLAENLMGMKVVNLFNRQESRLRRYSRLNEAYTEAQTASIRAYAYLQPAITVASGVSMALLIWYGGQAAFQGRIKVGLLVADFAYAVALFRPLREIADKWNVFLAGLAAAEKLFAVLEWPVELPEDAPAEPYTLRGDVVFENVWFAYEGERWVISDLSFAVSAGARVGIVGATGCGKSTLIALLMRFYEPQRGRILLDGKDLREYERRRLRASFGLVQQDVFLFSGSIEDNVSLFARPGANDGNGGAANPMAVFEELGVEIPIDRPLSERGGNVSAGERQLVSFARAHAARPSIWILDEATSNMDSTSELAMERVLERTAQDKTLLRVAHRLASTRACNPILVLHKGHLAEIGDHASLLAGNGLYTRLFKYQQTAEDPESA